jgi:triosephosphate isomerase (TIM)
VPPDTELIVIPSFLAIPAVIERARGTALGVGGQNLYAADAGAFTGEVSGAQLREVGCRFVEVGHAERARLFGETESDVSAKLAAAWRNGLCPILCIGEPGRGEPGAAAGWCADTLDRLLSAAAADGIPGDIVVAYEPVWAIGRADAASVGHIAAVTAAMRARLRRHSLGDARIIYGGSAGPGLLTELGDAVDGLFLGRFAHDPTVLTGILRERSDLATP